MLTSSETNTVPDAVNHHNAVLPLERADVAARSEALSWSFSCAGAFLTGIGSAMSLLIPGLAYSPTTLDAAKIGILGRAIVSTAAGLSVLGWLSRKKQTP